MVIFNLLFVTGEFVNTILSTWMLYNTLGSHIAIVSVPLESDAAYASYKEITHCIEYTLNLRVTYIS